MEFEPGHPPDALIGRPLDALQAVETVFGRVRQLQGLEVQPEGVQDVSDVVTEDAVGVHGTFRRAVWLPKTERAASVAAGRGRRGPAGNWRRVNARTNGFDRSRAPMRVRN